MGCIDVGLLVPRLWQLLRIEWFQAVFYLVILLYLFLGIAIIADIFMCSIERITSQTKQITIKSDDDTEPEVIEVKIWNDTVANLTLMALGSSAPEILLSIIEIVGNGFESGELGPGTIVGSAAFNLLVIIAICIVSIPNNEIRTIKAIKVFAITAFFSVFAYFWLFLILIVISPDIVELWEALVTFIYFPILVLLAYLADRNFFIRKNRREKEGMEMDSMSGHQFFPKGRVTKKSLARFMKEIRKIEPTLTHEDAACLAATYLFENETHSRLFYRVSAIRSITGSKDPVPKLDAHLQQVYDLLKLNLEKGSGKTVDQVDGIATGPIKTMDIRRAHHYDFAVVQFQAPTAVVLENAGKVDVTLIRLGRLDNEFECIVETLDRTAKSNIDYKPIKERVKFEKNETEKIVSVEIIDDNNWNPDNVFLVKLSLPEVDDEEDVRKDVQKGRLCMMQVTIIDDDEPGVIAFGQRLITIEEDAGKVVVPVLREQGADGEVTVMYKTLDGTSKSGRDFEGGEGKIVFPHGVIRREIEIFIVNDYDEEKDEYFEVILSDVTGGAKLGKQNRVMVTVTNDEDYNAVMTRLMQNVKKNREGVKLARNAWIEQFKTAMLVNGGDKKGGEDGEDKNDHGPTTLDYIEHVLCFFWKLLFAVVPPTNIWGGWLTFLVSLVMIGIITAIVGDVADAFGCLIGLKAQVTAITFVALGTSLPDLFASRTAARMEKYADNAVGNVTGSNSVNVFLGLGLPWSLAAIVHAVKGDAFKVSSGSLGFSVGLYTAVSLIGISILVARRLLPVFGPGELGGNPRYAMICCIIFISMWFIYIGLSTLQVYEVIG